MDSDDITKGAERLSNDSERAPASRLGLWTCSLSIQYRLFISEPLEYSPGI